ncbi:MAG: NAD(P)(+) transhydrogenase (Re/Si-specific) subunit beta [Spartobacteria bacterium]
MSSFISFAFLFAAVLFVLGIKMLNSPKTARMGNLVAGFGMIVALLAVVPQLQGPAQGSVPLLNSLLIVAGILAGLVIGAIGAYSVKMTGMPQMVALFNGAGGGAAALVAAVELLHHGGASRGAGFITVMLFAALIGALSFSGSLIAFLKLQGKFEKPLTYPGQKFVNAAILVAILVVGAMLATADASTAPLLAFVALSLTFGAMMVLPIGGADMPVVISLLNSFTGLAVAADGFAISNVAMIIAGTLVGSSGTLLTLFMCKAMNRPVTNVLFGAFGSGTTGESQSTDVEGSIKPIQVDELAMLLSIAQQVVIIPGYGLAVAQAQHQVKELCDELAKRGVETNFAIHPVAGRMPGHMNVLLAEANVPYDQLVEMESINPQMERIDVCLVIGANDVVNPSAREDRFSPIFGMPIIEAEKSRTVIVMKRSMGKGFAGIENRLFFRDNCRMLFGDAKGSLQALVTGVKAN